MNKPIKKRNLYYCPYDCSDSRFPQRKWKTEKGAIKHVDNCHMRPEEVEKRSLAEQVRKDKSIKRDQDLLNTAKYKIGDSVSYILKIVVKGTHEQRGTRLVKVRYEKECDYKARTSVIKSVRSSNGFVIYNETFKEGDVRDSFKKAEKEAIYRRECHLEGLKQASLMR